MSRLYGSVSGQAGSEATRQGSANSGIHGHLRGWNLGVRVNGYADGEADVFEVRASAGSTGAGSERPLATVRELMSGDRRFTLYHPDGHIVGDYLVETSGEVSPFRDGVGIPAR